jgi:hypothetical protein
MNGDDRRVNSRRSGITLAPVGAIFFYRFPDMARSSPDCDLARRWTLRVGLLNSLVRQRFGGHDIGKIREPHFVPQVFAFLQPALGF